MNLTYVVSVKSGIKEELKEKREREKLCESAVRRGKQTENGTCGAVRLVWSDVTTH